MRAMRARRAGRATTPPCAIRRTDSGWRARSRRSGGGRPPPVLQRQQGTEPAVRAAPGRTRSMRSTTQLGWAAAILGAVLGTSLPAAAQTPAAQTAAPADAVLYIIYPRDGQRIRGPFPVRFGLRNMGVTHAGDK